MHYQPYIASWPFFNRVIGWLIAIAITRSYTEDTQSCTEMIPSISVVLFVFLCGFSVALFDTNTTQSYTENAQSCTEMIPSISVILFVFLCGFSVVLSAIATTQSYTENAQRFTETMLRIDTPTLCSSVTSPWFSVTRILHRVTRRMHRVARR
jgi:uncharacterized membrane protein